MPTTPPRPSRARPTLTAALLLGGALLLSACGGDQSSAGTSTSTGAEPPSHAAPTAKPPASHQGDQLAPAAGLPSATPPPSGAFAADLGFRPETNGMPFENYGTGPYTNLTAVEMRAIFGDAVCASLAGGTCMLIPPAQDWMEQQNKGMGGGHCQGMSVTALLMFKGQLKAADYGADAVPGLTLDGNDALQRRIAQSFVFQAFPAIQQGTVRGTPSQVLDALVAALQSKGPLTYGLGIYKPDRSGGHEITPFAVVDRGDGKFGIEVYDNNYPKATREVVVDRNANTWVYEASTNPSEASSTYMGDATTNTLEIDPAEPGLQVQPCPFCGAATQSARSAGATGLADTATPAGTEEIFLDADPDNHAHLLITDGQGRRLGYAGTTFVNEIPGATAAFPKQDRVWKESEEPEYTVPGGSALTITLDGAALKAADNESISVIGPGIDLNVDSIDVSPGQTHTVAIPADRSHVTYTAGGTASPVISVGGDFPTADYAFTLNVDSMAAGATLDTLLRPDVLTLKPSAAMTVDVLMVREDDAGQQAFAHGGVALPAGSSASLQYGGWKKHGDRIPLVVTAGGSDQRSDLTDQS